MRELHAWHGDRHHARHARDAASDAPAIRAHDSPKHAAHDSLKLKMILDPDARKAAFFKQQEKIKEADAEYAARHAKPTSGDQGRAAEQLRPRQPKLEHASPETRDKPASKIDERRELRENQGHKRSKQERSWMPRADAVKAITDLAPLGTALAVALGGASAKWDAVVVAGATALVSNVAWANRRRKEKHGDRSEDRADD